MNTRTLGANRPYLLYYTHPDHARALRYCFQARRLIEIPESLPSSSRTQRAGRLDPDISMDGLRTHGYSPAFGRGRERFAKEVPRSSQ